MAQKDLYKILGIEKSATAAEIKKAFKRTAMKLHPDRNADDPSAQDKFKEAQMAYEILKDEQKRQTYDQYGFDAVSGQGGGQGPGGFGGGGTKYKNVKEGKLLEATESFGKKFLITEDAAKPKWILGSETKKIGNYTCFKATLIKETDASDWTNMRRRRGNNNDKKKDTTNTRKVSDEIEMPKTIEVTAWYTPQIPISDGPGNYWGLPGLILEINEGRTTILCSEIVINPEEKIEISAPKKGKKVTREEYTKIMKKKMEEMREMFRNRRGSRGGGRGR